MEMHAYSEDYLLTAQRILGDMLDYAVNEYEFDPDEFYKMFLVSDVSRQFQEGNPTYIAGKNGCEIVKEVIRSAGLIMEEIPDEMYLDKSPEWLGIGVLSVVYSKTVYEDIQSSNDRRSSKNVFRIS